MMLPEVTAAEPMSAAVALRAADEVDKQATAAGIPKVQCAALAPVAPPAVMVAALKAGRRMGGVGVQPEQAGKTQGVRKQISGSSTLVSKSYGHLLSHLTDKAGNVNEDECGSGLKLSSNWPSPSECQTKHCTGTLPFFNPQVLKPAKEHCLALGIRDCPAHTGDSVLPPTPKEVSSFSVTTPPGAPGGTDSGSALFHALRRGSFEQVQSVLESEPDAAVFPLEPHFEPALCCCVRLGCSEKIVQLLLQHSACMDIGDKRGQTPLMLLSAMSTNQTPFFYGFAAGRGQRQWSLRVAQLLIDADPIFFERSVPSCVDLAAQAGNTHLLQLYRGELDAAALNEEAECSPPSFQEFLVDWEAATQLPFAAFEIPMAGIMGGSWHSCPDASDQSMAFLGQRDEMIGDE